MGIDGMEMLHLGLTTHFVCEDAADTLATALQHTKSDSDDMKRIQPHTIRSESIPNLLEDMDVRSELDPLDDEIWDQMMLVHPKEIDQPLDVLYEGTLHGHGLREAIVRCFSSDSIEQVETCLLEENSPWATKVLTKMKSVDKELLKKWFELTRYAADPNRTEEEVCEMETRLVCDE